MSVQCTAQDIYGVQNTTQLQVTGAGGFWTTLPACSGVVVDGTTMQTKNSDLRRSCTDVRSDRAGPAPLLVRAVLK